MTDGWQGGSFSISIDMSANEAAGIPIVSSAFSNQMDVVKSGINATLTKDGSNTPTANLPMGGFKHTAAGAPSEEDQYLRVRELVHSFPIFMNDSEASSSLSLSVASSLYPVSLSAGMWVRVKAAGNKPSASAATISFHVNGLSANVVAEGETALWPGAFTSGQIHDLIYDGSAWNLQNPGSVWVTRNIGRFEGRLAGGAITTADGLPGLSVADPVFNVSVDIRRMGDKAELRMATFIQGNKPPDGNAGAYYVFQTPPAGIYLSALPDWMRPDERRSCDEAVAIGSAGAGSPVMLATYVSTDGKVMLARNALVAANTAQAFSDIGIVYPFTIIYRLKA